MSAALHAAVLRTWNRLDDVFHDLLCSMWCNEMCYVTTTPATQNDHGCQIVPRLPRETMVDVSLCRACHAKCRGVTRAQTKSKRATQCHLQTPATINDGRCEFVPRLPRKTTVDVSLCRPCHAASRAPKPSPSAPPSAICATPATQNDGRCQFVPRLPRKMPRRHARPKTKSKRATQCHLCHTCHAKRR